MINILLPTDFSENAKAATDLAISQFNHSQVEFLIYHAVIQPRSSSGMLVNITDIMLDDARKLLIEEENRIREKFGESVKMRTTTHVGYIEDVLPVLARKEMIDLVVMGTKGENDVASKVLGSNAEHVIRKSPIPVMTIPMPVGIDHIKEVIIATEKEELPHAAQIAEIFSSLAHKPNISVLTVITGDKDKAPKSVEFHGHQLPVRIVNASKASEGIDEFLHENEVDLLVMYHVHSSRLDYLFSRSITKKMAGHVGVPMLVVKE
ncbi:MAG: hypothetical protein GC181_12275 [Bacteroidetes bacterium]|nr:hypothetical protein [Bacteroidota bacterium]